MNAYQWRKVDSTWQVRWPKSGRWQDELEILHTIRPWRPFELTVPFGPGYDEDKDGLFYTNSHYLVFVREMVSQYPDKLPNGLHLSMRTRENDTRHDWREMQRVKTELAGPTWEGLEIYPAEDRIVDTANQYHLWCFPFTFDIGFQSGLVKTSEEAAATGATQRSFIPTARESK
jgi:hypothetical protein